MANSIFFGDLVLRRIDDANRAADFRGNPELGAVALEFGKARTRIDQDIGDDLACRGVDEMRHVGGFGRVDEDFAVRADRHAFGLDADLDFAEARAPFDIDDGHGVVVLVGDVENLAGRVLHEQLGIGAGGQRVDHLPGCGIDHLDGVVVADRDQHELAVPGEFDAARPLADLDGGDDRPFVGIDHRNRVALLVRHIGDEGRGGPAPASQTHRSEQQANDIASTRAPSSLQLAFGLGPVEPSVSSSEN